MLLTRLEIKGFKSFGDRIGIDFDEGVTGIVGPNGCGKSNVVDAIRWVLGEQKTRILRSDKMENVIFNGTKNRKPAQVAEVALSFINNKNILPSDYTKVTITRRYHRSGESEYFLNDIPCRLKDINNLFLDTGIGSDSYAIIELKMVDEILTDRENSRRSLFEKAAGISKFKVKKKEALLRLEGVDKDLERVEDLLHEIDKNLKSLERQAKQAEKYFELKVEYKNASIIFARKSISRQTNTLALLTEQIQHETDKKLDVADFIETKEELIEKEKQDVINYESNFYEKQKEANEYQARVRNLENERKIKTERLRFLKERTQAINSQITQDIEQEKQVQATIQNLEKRCVEAQVLLENSQKKVQEYQANQETQRKITQEIQQQLQAKQQQLQQAQQAMYRLERDYEIKKSQIRTAEQEIQQLQEEQQSLNNNLNQWIEKKDELDYQYEQIETQIEQTRRIAQQKQEEIEALDIQIGYQKEERNELIKTIEVAQKEFELLNTWLESDEYLPETHQFIKQNENKDLPAPPLLQDLFATKNDAVIRFLLPYQNYYVVQTTEQAWQWLNALEKEQKGKATFLVLEKIQSTNNNIQQKPAENAIAAYSQIQTETPYQKLFQLLLHDVWIVEEPEKHHKNYPNSTFLNPNGSLVLKGWQWQGGKENKEEKPSYKQRQNRIEELQQYIQTLKQNLEDQENDLREKQHLFQKLKNENPKQALYEKEQKLNDLKFELQSLNIRIDEHQKRKTQNSEKQNEITLQIEKSEAEITLNNPENTNIQQEITQLQNQIETLEIQWEEEKETLNQKSQIYNQENVAFYQQKGKVENIEQEITYNQKTQQELQQRIQKYNQEENQAQQDLQKTETALQNDADILETLVQEADKKRIELQEAERIFYSLRGKLNETEKELKELQRQKELLDELIGQLTNKSHETRLSLTATKERLAAEFQLDLEDIMNQDESENEQLNQENENLTEEQLKNKINDIRLKIERLGVINPTALETYQEVKERFDFIDEQKNDLTNSKQSLLKTIKEMESYAKHSFIESFEAIRQNFIKVFRSLFSAEDTADLVLLDPENPLDSKIEIIAKPKGKRPLTINQLSGGEKTLTATSLLFAIYLLKPAPFCIFDEVDAPLDDTNTDKFNQIIKNFAQDSQFIIVTHNKRTMANTDVMYGITMQEQGVSRVVPVDLRNMD
ncbi:MAG: chromosome segregation protein SMC [Cytophagales bacterium]|nr:MAG: chromosome segregation protein SMC [Cytophagales bacterium]